MRVTIKTGGKLKALYGTLAAFGALGILAYFGLVLGLVVISLYGLILAFSESILLGIVTLFVEPMPLVIGLCKVFAHINLAHKIVEFFN